MEKYAPEYDAMINLIGIDKSPKQTTLAGDSIELFEEWDRLQRCEV
jgi:hypothetical protein